MSKGDVKKWQRYLKKQKVYAGLLDGDFGPGTRRASFEVVSASEPSPISAQLVYINGSATRNQKCTANIEEKLVEAVTTVYGNDHVVKIYSGGQDRKGQGKRRTGSIRHDNFGNGGRAADVYVYDGDGNKLKGLKLARLGQYWLAVGNGGAGLEMAVGGIHLDEWTTPPPNAGMYWTYPYSNAKSWGAKAKKMLVDGSKGKMPKLAGS